MVLSDAFSYLEKKHLHHQHLMKLTLVPCVAGCVGNAALRVARCGGSKNMTHHVLYPAHYSNMAKASDLQVGIGYS